MSVEAYKIAVKIALTENVTRGLVMMSGHFKAANVDAKALEARLASIGKMTLLGGGLVAAGGAGLKILEAPLQKALDYEKYIAQMRQMGLGDSQIQDAKKFVEATDIINTSMLDRMRLFTEAQGAFRESGKSGSEALVAAKAMMPVLGTYEVAMSTLSGDKHSAAEQAMRNLSKTVEMMGGLGDTERAKEIADGVFKAVQSSGKMIDERQLKQFFAYGASATNQQSLRTVFGGLEPIIGELGGSTTAVGLRTAFTRTNGMMSLPPHLLLNEMQRLGMTDKTGKKQNKDLANLQSTDVIGYAEEMMRRYAKVGITSQTDRERENAIIFGTNGSKVYNKIMSQIEVLHESLAAYDKSKGASEVSNAPENKALMARQRLAKKVEDLQLVLGMDGGLIDLATKGLTALGTAISNITKFAHEHPMLTKFVVSGLAILSVLSILGGGLLLIKAALSALSLFGGPVVLAITAVSAAGYLLYKNWDKILPHLKKAWESVKTAFSQGMDWVVSQWESTAKFVNDSMSSVYNSITGWIQKLMDWVSGITGKAVDYAAKVGQNIVDVLGGTATNPLNAEAGTASTGTDKSPYVHQTTLQTVQVNTQLNMDGRKIGDAVTLYQVKGLNRATSSSSVDPTRSAPLPQMQYSF